MGMAGSVRLGTGVLRALPAGLECEIDLDGDGRPVSFAFDVDGDEAGEQPAEEKTFALYQDLADAIALDGGFDDVDLD
jgi:hypothetical protein